jgi:hypothetical protein
MTDYTYTVTVEWMNGITEKHRRMTPNQVAAFVSRINMVDVAMYQIQTNLKAEDPLVGNWVFCDECRKPYRLSSFESCPSHSDDYAVGDTTAVAGIEFTKIAEMPNPFEKDVP